MDKVELMPGRGYARLFSVIEINSIAQCLQYQDVDGAYQHIHIKFLSQHKIHYFQLHKGSDELLHIECKLIGNFTPILLEH